MTAEEASTASVNFPLDRYIFVGKWLPAALDTAPGTTVLGNHWTAHAKSSSIFASIVFLECV